LGEAPQVRRGGIRGGDRRIPLVPEVIFCSAAAAAENWLRGLGRPRHTGESRFSNAARAFQIGRVVSKGIAVAMIGFRSGNLTSRAERLDHSGEQLICPLFSMA